jgi:hypothetical protein
VCFTGGLTPRRSPPSETIVPFAAIGAMSVALPAVRPCFPARRNKSIKERLRLFVFPWCFSSGDVMRAQLLPLDGGSPIDIIKDLVVIGRKEDCDVRLEHKSVSKMHCVLVKTDGLLLLRDLGSTNGTRVNGTRVRRAALLPNDQISIAHYKFRVHLGPDVPSEAHPGDHTQHLNSHEVAELLRQARERAEKDDDSDSSGKPGGAGDLHRNQLPDVYPKEAGSS